MRRYERRASGLEHGVAGAVHGGAGVAGAVVDAVCELVGAALRAGRRASAPADLAALADAAVKGASRSGGDICWVARGFLLGVLRFGGEEGEAGLELAQRASAAFTRAAHQAGSDLAESARGLAEAAVVWAGEVGLDAGRAASAAGQGATDESCEIGEPAEAKVRACMRVGVAGMPVLIHEPPHHAAHHHRR